MRRLHWDPNVLDDAQNTQDALFPMRMRLPDWFAAWAAGKNLWDSLESGAAFETG